MLLGLGFRRIIVSQVVFSAGIYFLEGMSLSGLHNLRSSLIIPISTCHWEMLIAACRYFFFFGPTFCIMFILRLSFFVLHCVILGYSYVFIPICRIFDTGNVDLDEENFGGSSEFKNKPDGWESTSRTQDGNIWEISQREEDILLQEFERRIAYSKFQVHQHCIFHF